MIINFYSQEQWKEVGEEIHQLVFNEYKSGELARFDFAMVVWEEENPIAYMTCRETDSESIYIGYGGVFPESRNVSKSVRSTGFLLETLQGTYKRANMLVENSNIAMIKMAFKFGFKVVGVANYRGSILLDLRVEWGD